MNLLQRIVTPTFIAFQAHCWFAYALVFTFPHWVYYAVLGGAAVKEFYIDKHFEANQTFRDNLLDYVGYVTGAVIALCAKHFF